MCYNLNSLECPEDDFHWRIVDNLNSFKCLEMIFIREFCHTQIGRNIHISSFSNQWKSHICILGRACSWKSSKLRVGEKMPRVNETRDTNYGRDDAVNVSPTCGILIRYARFTKLLVRFYIPLCAAQYTSIIKSRSIPLPIRASPV